MAVNHRETSQRRSKVSEVGRWQGMGLRDKRPASGHEWGDRGAEIEAFLLLKVGLFWNLMAIHWKKRLFQVDDEPNLWTGNGVKHTTHLITKLVVWSSRMSWCEVAIEDPHIFFMLTAVSGCERAYKSCRFQIFVCRLNYISCLLFWASSLTMHHKTEILTSFNC